jgi:uncharacterized integral membrane protein
MRVMYGALILLLISFILIVFMIYNNRETEEVKHEPLTELECEWFEKQVSL